MEILENTVIWITLSLAAMAVGFVLYKLIELIINKIKDYLTRLL